MLFMFSRKSSIIYYGMHKIDFSSLKTNNDKDLYKEAANYTNTINPSVVIPTHYGLIVGDVNLGQKFKSLINDNTSCEIYIK